MSAFGRRGVKIAGDKDSNRACAVPFVPGRLDLTHQCAHITRFALADFTQHVPEFGLQPYAGPSVLRDDVTDHKATDCHDYLLLYRCRRPGSYEGKVYKSEKLKNLLDCDRIRAGDGQPACSHNIRHASGQSRDAGYKFE